jgi:hypothetical protein
MKNSKATYLSEEQTVTSIKAKVDDAQRMAKFIGYSSVFLAFRVDAESGIDEVLSSHVGSNIAMIGMLEYALQLLKKSVNHGALRPTEKSE